MKRFDSLLLKVFLYGLPVFVLLAVFAYLYSTGAVDRKAPYAGFLNGLGGLAIALEIALSLYLSFRLLISVPFRDHVIARITLIRERDEREAHLTGKAARTTFVTSLAFLILLFCLSCFQVSLYRVPQEKAIDGKTGMLTLSIGFHLLNDGKPERPEETIQKKDIFSYQGLPFSSTSVILLLIAWQIVSYNYSMRRLMK